MTSRVAFLLLAGLALVPLGRPQDQPPKPLADSLASPELDMARVSGTLTIAVATDGAQLDGAAAEGATVVAVPAGRQAEWPDLVRSAIAGKDGKFELRDLAPGDYQVFPFEDAEPGVPLDPDFRKPFEKQATPVHLTPNEHATVRLR